MSDALVAGLAIGKSLADLSADLRSLGEISDQHDEKLDALRGTVLDHDDSINHILDGLQAVADSSGTLSETHAMVIAVDGMLSDLRDSVRDSVDAITARLDALENGDDPPTKQ